MRGERNGKRQIHRSLEAYQRWEAQMASGDTQQNRAAGPDLFPAEICRDCASLRRAFAALFTATPERNYVPERPCCSVISLS